MSKTKKQAPTKSKLFDISMIFFVFSVLIIPNIYYKLALDKHLDIRYLSLALFLLILTIPLIYKNRTKFSSIDFNILKTPVVLIYLAYFVLVTLSSLWATNFSEASYEFLKTATFFFLFVYLILFIVPKEKSKDAAVTTFVALGIILAFLGFSQFSDAFKELGFGIKTAYLVKGNNAHKNIFAQVLFITFSLSAYGIYYFKDFRNKLSMATAFANLLLILMLMTRSVWVAMLVSTISTVIVYFVFLRKDIPLKKLTKLLIPLVIIGVLSAIIFTLYSGLDKDKQVRTHLSEGVQIDKGNAVHRIALWKKSFLLLKESPIVGVGAGNWKINILKYDVTKGNKKGHIVPRRTHNDYVSVITETGILGFLIYMAIFALIIFQAIKLFKLLEKEEDKIFMLTMFFALVGYLTYSFFSFPKERIETQMFLNTIMAFIVYEYYALTKAQTQKKSNTATKYIKPVSIIVAVILLIAVKSGYDRVQAEVNIQKIYGLRQSPDFDLVYDLAGESITPFARISPFSEPFVKIQASMLYQKRLKDSTSVSFQEVVDKYEEAINEIPYHVKTLLELAQIYVTDGNPEKAIEYTTLAYQYAPTNIRVQVAHAYFLKKAGYPDEGYSILRTINPNKKFDQYVGVRTMFLKDKTVKLYNNTSNNKIKSILNTKYQDDSKLSNIYKRSFENFESFEKSMMTQVFKQINSQDTLNLNDTSISNIINKYNINLDSLNSL